MKYIALLRGVNVGGKNKLPMPELRHALEKQGFTEVSTYINSGNVIFSGAETDTASLQARCREVIRASFGLEIDVAVFAAHTLADAVARAPKWWNADPESKHNAIFVIAPATAVEVCALVGEAKPEYERTECVGPVIFWTAPIKTFSRTRWSKIVASPAYASVTIRNANTALKLAELACEPDAGACAPSTRV